jgi:hypothetical protein
MTKTVRWIAAAAILALAVVGLPKTGSCVPTRVSDIAWDQSNLSKLRSFSKDDILDFLVQTKDDVNDEAILLYLGLGDDSRCIEGFTWADLAGDHRYDLVVVFEPQGTSLTTVAAIYRRSSSGKISVQTIDGDGIALDGNESLDAPKVLQDLNGDGKYELVVPMEWGSTMASDAVISIKVYRLSDGKYVEASHDFPKFYDQQILPKLESEIAQIKRNPSSGEGLGPPAFGKPVESDESQEKPERTLALFEMDRDKILRVIGRDPKAGEKEAREWVKSGDYVLIGDAMSVFEDIGDHESDLQAAKLAWKHAARESFKHKAGQ